jgi:hypothetical protein
MPEAELFFSKIINSLHYLSTSIWLFGQALPFILRYFTSLPRDNFAVLFVQRHSSLHIRKLWEEYYAISVNVKGHCGFRAL